MLKILIKIVIVSLTLVWLLYIVSTSEWFNNYLRECSMVQPSAYIQQSEFPEQLTQLTQGYDVIKAELANIIDKFKPIRGDQFFDESIATNDGWKRFYIKWFSAPNEMALQYCPKTCELIESIGCIKTAMFSMLDPHTRIPVHRGPYFGVIRYHLGVLTPNDENCFISVNDEKYVYRDGESVMFDDTYPHYVTNDTDNSRIVLFCDVERPMNTILSNLMNKMILNVVGPLTFRDN